MDEETRNLRFKVFEYLLDQCRPPTVDELASRCACTASDVQSMLKRLQELHHLKLYDDKVPSPTPIAMAHPFSHLLAPKYLYKLYVADVHAGQLRTWWFVTRILDNYVSAKCLSRCKTASRGMPIALGVLSVWLPCFNPRKHTSVFSLIPARICDLKCKIMKSTL